MRIVFMGTPEFAVPSLEKLLEQGYEVVAVVTQADKPTGRGHVMKAPPVKEYALAKGIEVIQPERLSRQPEMVEKLHSLKPDLFITCAFGQFLPQSVLDIPPMGTINVHGSLLPKYRGAAPIQRAVINGEKVTGITTMLTDIGMDTGDMLLKATIEIPEDMTAGELHDKMSLLGADLLIQTLKELEAGRLTRIKQDDGMATKAERLDKETGHICWSDTSNRIHNLIRGTTPWPGAYTEYGPCRMRIWKSRIPAVGSEVLMNGPCAPGTILKLDADGMLVKTGDGMLWLHEIQVDSCKRMTPWVYCCGHPLEVGNVLGES